MRHTVLRYSVLRYSGQVRVIDSNDVVDELAKVGKIFSCGKDLKVAESDKGWGDAADDRARFTSGTTIVKHIPNNPIACLDQRKRSGGGHPEMMHGFTAKELSQTRSKNGKAIRVSRIGSGAGTFELQHPAFAMGVDNLSQIDRTTVS